MSVSPSVWGTVASPPGRLLSHRNQASRWCTLECALGCVVNRHLLSNHTIDELLCLLHRISLHRLHDFDVRVDQAGDVFSSEHLLNLGWLAALEVLGCAGLQLIQVVAPANGWAGARAVVLVAIEACMIGIEPI